MKKIPLSPLPTATMNVKHPEINKGTAYFLWAIGFLAPICGLHRFYAGKPVSGTLYLFTLGFFYIGQIFDVFFIPNMVDKRNREFLEKTKNEALISLVTQNISYQLPRGQNDNLDPYSSDPLVKLLKVAAQNNNTLSLGQAMISLEMSHKETEALLNKALKEGLAHVDNDPNSGAVRYYFDI